MQQAIDKALLSLEGLSVGDAFGAALGEGQSTPQAQEWVERKTLPPGPWHWTDDTAMACSIVEILDEFEEIERDDLAEYFAERYTIDPSRGYGAGAHQVLQQIADGEDWREASRELFDGGSYGNGAAMRAAPIGAYFAGEHKLVVKQARRSAMVTHGHKEGQAGAAAVAVAASLAASEDCPRGEQFLLAVTKYLPPCEVTDGIHFARHVPEGDIKRAAERLGTGWKITAQDTVPFALWCVAYNLDDFEAAMWTTAAGQGDRDTTCAIVAGIVALSVGNVPEEWLARREPLPSDFAV